MIVRFPKPTWSAPAKRSLRGYLLIEMLAYMGVLLVVLTVGFAALYRGINHSAALRRNAAYITGALEAGERWRADVRGARGPVRLEDITAGQILHLPQSSEEIDYLFSTNTVLRRAGGGTWTSVLANVETSTVAADRRPHVAAWRWELELQAQKKKLNGFHPLFTFIAVPEVPRHENFCFH